MAKQKINYSDLSNKELELLKDIYYWKLMNVFNK